jgi:hypothetical protein
MSAPAAEAPAPDAQAPGAPPVAAAPPTAVPTSATPPAAPLLRTPIVPVYRLARPRLEPLPDPPRKYGNAGAPFAVGLGGAVHFRPDAGYRALGAGKQQGALDLFASYDVLQPVRPLVLAAGINYRHERAGDQDSVALTQHTLHAEVSARYTLTTWLFPHLRAGIGLNTAVARLSDDLGGFSARDRATSISGALGGGLTLRTPRRAFETRNGRVSSF